MNIFEKRPLSLILCIMLGGFSLFADFTVPLKLGLIFAILATFAAMFIFENKIPGSKLLLRLSALSLAIGILLSILWSLAFFPTKYHNDTVNLQARIYDIDDSSYNVKVTLKTSRISNKRDVHKLVLYTDSDTVKELKKYDIVEITAELYSFSQVSTDVNNGYLISRGFSGSLENTSSIELIDHKDDVIDKLLSDIRLNLSNILKKRTDFQTGSFLTALIIGERDDLDGNTRLNFSRIGISHVLALSGMHLAILSAALTKLLSLFGINKKIRTAIMLFLTLAYMTLTGFAPSVFRAGVMLIITGILYLLSRTHDSITSLFIAVTVILIFTPHAAYDVSLWLSAFATLGVILFAELSKELKTDSENVEKQSKIKSFLKFISDGILISVFAFSATFAISATRFNGFSLFSVVTTLIFSFFIELMIYAGLLVLTIGWIIPLGRPIIFLSDFIKEVAEILSNAKWAYVSCDYTIIKLLIISFSVIFFLFIILDTKKKKLSLIILVSMLGGIFFVAEISATITRYTPETIYAPNVAGDIFIMKSNGNTSVIYSGKGNTSAAYEISNTIAEEKITYLDRLILANYSYTTHAFCEKVISSCKTEFLYVPIPLTKDEINQAEALADILSLYGTKLEFYDMLEQNSIDKYSVRFFDRREYIYGEYPMNVFEINIDNHSYTYITAGNYDYVGADAKALLYNSENLFIGSGSNVKYYPFDMVLPDIKSINFSEEGRLTDKSFNYYTSIDADLNLIQKPTKVGE